MAMNIKIKLDNTEAIKKATAEQIAVALESCGLVAESYAKLNCTEKGIVDTGNLRNSITHQVEGRTMAIGTNVHYAPYHEYGTGVHYEGGRRTPWVYKDSEGRYHMTSGMKARPFIKPAIADHIDEYKNIIERELKQ